MLDSSLIPVVLGLCVSVYVYVYVSVYVYMDVYMYVSVPGAGQHA